MFRWLGGYFSRCKRNWVIMRAAVDRVGSELESLADEDIKRLISNEAAAYYFEREFEGVILQFTLQECDLNSGANVASYYLTCTGLTTLGGIKPSYEFSKLCR